MSTLAPILQAFFTDRLATQRQASPHTVASYRDTFRLLLGFAWQRTGTPPCRLSIGDLDAALVTAFLQHLQADRANSPATANIRLAAIHSLFRYAALRAPEHADVIQQVLAVAGKRTDRAVVCFLTKPETDALLGQPDRSSWIGRRDYALLQLAVQTGLRVSELINLTCQDAHLGTGAYVRCVGKGRKERGTPMTAPTVAALRDWLRERHTAPGDPLFITRRNAAISPDAVERLIAKYATNAARRCPSLAAKRVSPHVLRHTAAMALLHSGVDIAVIALWLGHESIQTTQIYLHADLALKERALARTAPPDITPGRYHPPDTLLAYLEAL